MPGAIGCIGCGNMGSALLKGFASHLDENEWKLCGFNRSPEKMLALREQGIEAMPGIPELVAASDLIILAVKPNQVSEVLKQAKPALNSQKTLVSVVAGCQLATLRSLAGNKCALARCMPTTTALVGRGVFAFCFDDANFTRLKQLELLELFDKLGYCVELPEKRFTQFSALIGAGPAYVFAVMQGLSQAGLTIGFTLEQTRRMLTELFAGSAELAARQPKSFIQLRDDVCSPGGLTIAGVNVLDRAGLSGLFVDAVEAAYARGKEMES